MQSNETEEKWHLPAAFDVTKNPELLAKNEAWQRELALKASSPFASLSPADAERARAARMAEHLAGDLNRLNRKILEASISGDRVVANLEAGHDAITARLAEAYATIGRYDLAAKTVPAGAQRNEYISILEAIHRDDSEFCECPPGRDFIKRDIVMPDGQQRVLRACQCGQMNVVAIPSHLAEQRGFRAKARQVTAGMNMRDATELLRSRGHVHGKLIK